MGKRPYTVVGRLTTKSGNNVVACRTRRPVELEYTGSRVYVHVVDPKSAQDWELPVWQPPCEGWVTAASQVFPELSGGDAA